MNNRIPTPTMGEILTEEFLIPMNLTAYKLAQSIHPELFTGIHQNENSLLNC